jgi:group II intron reverse transcriptase/maturase
MIEKVLHPRNLYKAYHQVVSNKGAAGIDQMDISEFSSRWEEIRNTTVLAILKMEYRPSPIRGVVIPKTNGKTRTLGVPTVIDRWLQQAVSQQLASKFDLGFEEESFGFRPQRNLQMAVRRSLKHINDGYQDIVDIDLKGFFDEVPHYKLLQLVYDKVKCRTTLWLIRKWLRAPILLKGKLHKRRKGIPQGSPLSPLLSNILPDQLDKHLKGKGHRFIRYADDFSIYANSKATARKIGNEVYLFLRDKLDLPINPEKSGIRRPGDFKVLGFGFVPTYKKGERGKYQLIVAQSGWQALKRKLKAITKKTMPYSLDERLRKLEEVWRGWVNNYRMASIYTKLKKLDEWLRNRLRYCIWHDWKKPERKRKNLIRLGVPIEKAYAWSRTRLGGWAIAQSPILGTTITVSRLKRRGYLSMVDYYQTFRSEIQ